MSNTTTKSTSAIAWFLLILLALVWGSSFILVKKSLHVFQASQVGSLRIFSAFCFFVPIFLYNLKKIPFKDWYKFLIVGCLGNLFPAFLFSLAGTKLDSAISGALNSTTPLFTLVIGGLFFNNRITKRQLYGIIIGFVGALMLVLAGKEKISINLYALLVILATLLYGINLQFTKKYLTNIGLDSLVITSCIFMTIGPVSGVVLFSSDFVDRLSQDGALPALGYGVLLGVMGSAIAMVLFNRLIQMTSAVLASSVTYLIPIVAMIWGALDNEAILIEHYLGMSIILVGVYLVNKSS
ncbi:DMT family transporter [Cellulophaga sp. BC115SP]|uniref:DMT family transporter n=1 Tax=Cellulophaga sp. BC115SP TaxID=2683263 RepID=UPI001412F27C|nr:DMT family transporter [Cellulophaga sp. BC115SP]NBB28301.1 EamA family transporter [Cellulophaga sp. BC115SP]